MACHAQTVSRFDPAPGTTGTVRRMLWPEHHTTVGHRGLEALLSSVLGTVDEGGARVSARCLSLDVPGKCVKIPLPLKSRPPLQWKLSVGLPSCFSLTRRSFEEWKIGHICTWIAEIVDTHGTTLIHLVCRVVPIAHRSRTNCHTGPVLTHRGAFDTRPPFYRDSTPILVAYFVRKTLTHGLRSTGILRQFW